MLHEGKGEGEREGEGKGKGRGRRMGGRLLKLPTLQTQLHKHMSSEMTPFLSASLRRYVDGVIDGILLNTQVEDPVCTAGGEAVSIRCCDGGLNYYLHRQQNLTLSVSYVTHIGCSYGDHPSPPSSSQYHVTVT